MGVFEDLMGAGQKFLDSRYADNEKFRESFKKNPLGHLMQDAMTGMSAIGAGGPPMTKMPAPLPPGGAAPPPGNYFRPSPPPDRWMSQTSDPVASMKGYAEAIEGLDPKIIASQLRRFWGDEALPYAERSAATNPAFGEVAAHLRRNQGLIDLMSNAEANGPWGPR